MNWSAILLGIACIVAIVAYALLMDDDSEDDLYL